MPVPFTCPHCGHQTLVHDQYVGQSGPCAGCGRTVTVLPPGFVPPSPIDSLGENAGIRLLLPVGRSFWAIAAGYAGLFAVLFLPAPIALILGVVAILDIKQHPEEARHGQGDFRVGDGCNFHAADACLFRCRGDEGFQIAAARHYRSIRSPDRLCWLAISDDDPFLASIAASFRGMSAASSTKRSRTSG